MTKSWKFFNPFHKRIKSNEDSQPSALKTTTQQYSTATAVTAQSTITVAITTSPVKSPQPTLISADFISTISPPHKPIALRTTVHKPSALDIPEILVKIGHAIPQFSTYVTVRYSPKQILRCTRVSRLWYNVMMPLVWHSFDDSVMNVVPVHVLKQNAHWIRVLNHHHNFGGQAGTFAECQNLVQLTLSPWVGGVEELIKANKRLTKVCWASGGFYQEIADSSLDAISQLPRLEVLQISGCRLNHRKLLIVLNTLSTAGRCGLTSLVLSNVSFLDPIMSLANIEMAEKTVPEQVALKELQISQSLVNNDPILGEFVSRCTSLERVQINGDKSVVCVDKNQRLSECLARNCPGLKFFHYNTDKTYDLHSLPVFLPTTVASRYIKTINGKEQGKSAPHDEDEGASWWPIGLKMDSLTLDSDMTLAVCTLDFLDTLEFTLFETKDSSSLTADLKNTLQMLTTCRHLRVFQLEYASILRFNEPMLSPGQACVLFLQPWCCTHLERFAYSGIKRPVKRESEFVSKRDVVVDTSANCEDMFLPLKMSELLMDVSQAHSEWVYKASVECVRKKQLERTVSTMPSTGRRNDEEYPGTTILDDIREFQEKMFAQVKQLKRLRTIAFNGEERSDFSVFA
ncbi:hypothetical protein BGZ59_007262 [Podila verticillata]|nr:hypothetical protein BGZ59_007262 [Podila verticillata]KFH67211.1 hypothetical protein MVEG_07733 [Podila verticillata NRRL 6337]